MFNLGMPELILVLVIALVVFGPGKLPEVGKALGRSMREFKQATSEVDSKVVHMEPAKENKEEPGMAIAKAEDKK